MTWFDAIYKKNDAKFVKDLEVKLNEAGYELVEYKTKGNSKFSKHASVVIKNPETMETVETPFTASRNNRAIKNFVSQVRKVFSGRKRRGQGSFKLSNDKINTWQSILKIEPKDNPLSDEFNPPEIPEKLITTIEETIYNDLTSDMDKVPELNLIFTGNDRWETDFIIDNKAQTDDGYLALTLPIITLVANKKELTMLLFEHQNRRRRQEYSVLDDFIDRFSKLSEKLKVYITNITYDRRQISRMESVFSEFINRVKVTAEKQITFGDKIFEAQVDLAKRTYGMDWKFESPELYEKVKEEFYDYYEKRKYWIGNISALETISLEELIEDKFSEGKKLEGILDTWIEDFYSDYEGDDIYDYDQKDWDEMNDYQDNLAEGDLQEERLEEGLRGRRNRG